jgi:broad specificity phosphatase PhoE
VVVDKGTGHAYPAHLLLARHGETDWNRDRILQGQVDVPLNANGRRQAHELAVRLGGWEIDALYTSDLVRAAETATILGNVLGLEPRLSADLREIDVGRWGGLTHAELERRYPEEVAALARGEDVPRGGAERVRELQERMVTAFERIGRDHPGQTVLLVSHGGALRTLIAHLLGLDLHEGIRRLSTRGNTGLTHFRFIEGTPQLVLFNDTCHLNGRR